MYSRTFFALMLSNASLRVATMMLVALVPLYAFDLGLSPAEVGLTSTLYFATAALSRPLAGWLVDAKGRWMAMLLGASFFTIGTGLHLLSLPVRHFLALRALQGAGFSLKRRKGHLNWENSGI
ncbi:MULTISPECIES: MFS transporter [Glutamicibacter]|nr:MULTISPECIES: MFS transporter [Glutamicibacter]